MAQERRYHNTESGYSLPNDAPEHLRLDEQHEAIRQMIGGDPFITDIATLSAPTHPFKALDIGTGTGIMAVLLAHRISSSSSSPSNDSKIYGLDLSPVPPIPNQAPNLTFIQGNIWDLAAKQTSPLEPDTYDFVFSRTLLLGMTDWEAYARVCFSLLRPGGRVEWQEVASQWYDAEGRTISDGWRWLRVFKTATARFGTDVCAPQRAREILEACGFVDVRERVFRWTIGEEEWEGAPDSAAIGRYTVNSLNKAFPVGVAMVAQRAGLESAADLEGLEGLEAVKEDYAKTVTGCPRGAHAKYYVVTGRKP